MTHRTFHAAALAAGTIALLYGIFDDGRIGSVDILAIALIVILGTLGSLALSKITRPNQAAYELGLADGHRAGYEAGRKASRPTVVRFEQPRCTPGVCCLNPHDVVARGETATSDRAVPRGLSAE